MLCRFDKYAGSRNVDELNKLLTGTFMIRRRKHEVLTQLPPKLREQVSCARMRTGWVSASVQVGCSNTRTTLTMLLKLMAAL